MPHQHNCQCAVCRRTRGEITRNPKTVITLTRELQEGLQDLSRKTGRSQSQIIREALAAYLEHQARR